MERKEPQTREEWQEAVDAAEACLLLDDSRLYGLIKGGPEVNRDRAIQILKAGKKMNITPASNVAERIAKEIVFGQKAALRG